MIESVVGFMHDISASCLFSFRPHMPHSLHNAPHRHKAYYDDVELDDAALEYFAMISRFDEVAGELPRDVGEDTVIYNMPHNGFVHGRVGRR